MVVRSCPRCSGKKLDKYGRTWIRGKKIQKYRCDSCGFVTVYPKETVAKA